MTSYYVESRDVRDRYESTDSEPNHAMSYGKKFKCLRTKEPRNFHFKPHQQFVIDQAIRMVNDPGDTRRGILLYHTLGLGKTCTSIGMADRLLATGKFDGVIVLSPAGLRANFVQEYCQKCGLDNINKFSHKFSFFAYNYTGILSNFPDNFNRVIFIIDEIHNLIISTVNRSNVRSEIYNRIFYSEDSFIIGLSGTPIYSSPNEIYFLSSLFYKYTENPFHVWKSGEFEPKAFNEFLPKSVDDAQLTSEELLHTTMVKNLSGIVSYVATKDNHYPGVAKNVIVLTPMTNYADQLYQDMVAREEAILKLPICKTDDKVNYDMIPTENAEKGEKAICYLARIKFFSSRVCNISYPHLSNYLNTLPYELRNKYNLNQIIDMVYGTKTKRLDEDTIRDTTDKKLDDALENKLPEFNSKPGYYLSDRELSLRSQIYLNNLPQGDGEIYEYLDMEALKTTYSPKFYQLIKNIEEQPGKHAVFCHYKVNSGVYLISALLTKYGISNVVYSGDTEVMARHKYLQEFNAVENLEGKKIRVILLTDAGTEGLSLTACESIHIISPKSNQTKINQVIGRVQRLHSHDLLPLDRRFVNIYYYLTTFNPAYFFSEIPNIDLKIITNPREIYEYFRKIKEFDQFSDSNNDNHDFAGSGEISSDISLYERAIMNDYMVQQSMKYLQLASIENSEQLFEANKDDLINQLVDEFTYNELRLIGWPPAKLTSSQRKNRSELINKFREITKITISRAQRLYLLEQAVEKHQSTDSDQSSTI